MTPPNLYPTRAEALAASVHAEPLLNGRCIGDLEMDEQTGATVLVITWHAAGCEHEAWTSPDKEPAR